MNLFKFALNSRPALISLDYTEGAGNIILAVNTSLEGWKGVLMQLVKKKDIYHDIKARFGLARRKGMMLLNGNVEEF